MTISHSIKYRYFYNGEEFDYTDTVSAGQENNLSEVVADQETDKAINWSADVSSMKSLMIHTTRDVTIKTNSSSTPDQTFTLKANQPLVWSANSPAVNPLTADVTGGLFVTNSSGEDAKLTIKMLQDPTP